MAAGVKLTPTLFLPFLLLAGRRKDAVRMVATFLGTVTIGILVAPSASLHYWRHLVFTSDRIGLPSYISNQSLRGALERTGIAHSAVLWSLLAIAVAVVGLFAAARADRAGQTLHALAAVALTMLLISPISWTHHWVWLLPLVALLLFAPLTDRAGLVLLLCWLFATITWLVWKVAPVGRPTPRLAWDDQILGDSYTILACVSLVWLVVRIRQASGPVPSADPTDDVPTARDTAG